MRVGEWRLRGPKTRGMVPQGPEEAAEGSDRGVQSRQVTQQINSRGGNL